VSLNLYNEPLADKSIYGYIEQLRRGLPNAYMFFNSNGDYLNNDVLDELDKLGLNSITVTLHPSKNRHYEEDDRMRHMIKTYKRLGRSLDILDYKRNDFILSKFTHGDLEVKVRTKNWGKYGESRAGAITDLVEKKKRNWPCARPFREFTLFHDGYSYPCCNIFSGLDEEKKYSVGKLSEYTSIFDLYASSAMVEYRKDLFGMGVKNPPCDVCTEPFRC